MLLCYSDVRLYHVTAFGQGNVSGSALYHVKVQVLGDSVLNEAWAISLGFRLKATWKGVVVDLG